jgi:hypothetical protein
VIRGCLALAALLLVPGPVGGQWVEAVEIGLLGRYGFYDRDVGLANAPGTGGRLGVHFGPRLGVEVDWLFQAPRPVEPPDPDVPEPLGHRVSHDLFGLRALYTRPVGDRTDLLSGLGFAYDRYYREREVGVSGGGLAGLLALRFGLNESVSLRLEAAAYRIRRDADRPLPRPSTTNLGLQAALSYTFRGREVERIVELPPPPPDTVLVLRDPDEDPAPEAPSWICGAEGEYAHGQEWFEGAEPLVLPDPPAGPPVAGPLRRDGSPAALECEDVLRVGSFRGTPVFVAVGAEPPYEILLVPVRPGIWQAYRAPEAPGEAKSPLRPEET